MRRVVTVILLCIVFSVQVANAIPMVDWKLFKLPGFHNGIGMQRGMADELLDYFEEHMPEWSHTRQMQPIVRIFTEMAQEQEYVICSPSKTALGSEFSGKVVRSDRNFILPPPGIVIRTHDLGVHFTKGAPVSIESLLDNDKLSMAWIKGATYAPAIREVVEARYGNNNVNVRSEISESFLQMLGWKRIDFYVDHAIPFQWSIASEPARKLQFTFLPVEEATLPVPCYTFCNDTPQGRAVIERVNQIVHSKDFSLFLRGIIEKYYPASLQKRYLQLHKLE